MYEYSDKDTKEGSLSFLQYYIILYKKINNSRYVLSVVISCSVLEFCCEG